MVSAVVLTRNEEKNIKECLNSLSWCDEIIVADDYSEDNTAKIARRLGAKVHERHLQDDFAAQRNFGLGKVINKWVLFIDADEIVSQDLAAEIKQKTEDRRQKTEGFYIKRRDFMWGRELKHGEAGNVRLLRLARKDAGRRPGAASGPEGKWRRRVHEVWEVSGPLETLQNPLYHYPHRTLREFISDVDRMSTLHARSLKKEGKSGSIFKILFWPPLKFFHNWVAKRGFMDGTVGFMVAAVMSFHSFLGWSKLWLAERGQRADNRKQILED